MDLRGWRKEGGYLRKLFLDVVKGNQVPNMVGVIYSSLPPPPTMPLSFPSRIIELSSSLRQKRFATSYLAGEFKAQLNFDLVKEALWLNEFPHIKVCFLDGFRVLPSSLVDEALLIFF